jgi:aromatic-L-amino-acid/L-tryptophan decarboxylase
MRPDVLAEAIRADRSAGRSPIFITATLGTTAAMAIDDLAAIAPIAREHNLWLHIDAAYAGSALICPEHRSMLGAPAPFDSLCFNPHKWLLTNFDCTLFYTADRLSLTRALSITPEYLRNAATDAGAVWDYRDWQVPLGRRFRALKLWLVLRCYGLDGLRAHIREHCRLAELLESLIRAADRFEIPVPRALGLVCFRLRSGNADSKSLLDRINKDGRLFLSHAVLPDGSPHGLYILRMAIGATFTQEDHIRRAWSVIADLAQP